MQVEDGQDAGLLKASHRSSFLGKICLRSCVALGVWDGIQPCVSVGASVAEVGPTANQLPTANCQQGQPPRCLQYLNASHGMEFPGNCF